MRRIKTIISLIMFMFTVALAMYAYRILPEYVGLQLQFNGQLGNYLPKLLAISLMIFVFVFTALIYIFASNKIFPDLLILFLGIIVLVLTMIFNLK